MTTISEIVLIVRKYVGPNAQNKYLIPTNNV